MKRKKWLLSLALSTVLFSTLTSKVAAEEGSEHYQLSEQDSQLIAQGGLVTEKYQYDSLLYGQAPLDPNADDDGDGLLNKDELYTYEKEGLRFFGYASHPRLADTDGDGLADGEDTTPLQWTVSARDMALFMELSYREDFYIVKVLDYLRPLSNSDYYKGRLEYGLMHNELSRYWQMKKSWHEADGFDAALFVTQSPYSYLENGEVQVLAIRGTQGVGADTTNDLQILFGREAKQVASLGKVLASLNNWTENGRKVVTNLYVTGHSLGGYLSEYSTILASENNYSWLRQNYTFNAPRIKNKQRAQQATVLYQNGVSVHYVTNNDPVINRPSLGHFPDEQVINIGTTQNAHGSRSFLESLLNTNSSFNPGLRQEINGVGLAPQAVSKNQELRALSKAEIQKLPQLQKEQEDQAKKEVHEQTGRVIYVRDVSASGGDGSEDNPYLSLTYALEQVEDGDTLTLMKDALYNRSKSLTLDKKLTIDGQGNVLRVRNPEIVLEKDVTFKDVTINLVTQNGIDLPRIHQNGHEVVFDNVHSYSSKQGEALLPLLVEE